MGIAGCSGCLCVSCLKYHARSCPNGGCYDDWRAAHQPYPGEERRSWSEWNKPGEQAHWCRGGMFYEAKSCGDFVEYDAGQHTLHDCFGETVERFQDGTILCGFNEIMGCKKCIEMYGDGLGEEAEE